MTTPTPQARLLAAVCLIESRGLARGQGEDAHGAICTIRALGSVGGEWRASAQLLAEHLGFAHYYRVVRWSDAPDEAVVIQTLREAAGVTVSDPHEQALVA